VCTALSVFPRPTVFQAHATRVLVGPIALETCGSSKEKGYDSTGNFGLLNDLWKFSSVEWTWMDGSNLADQPGTYGTVGVGNANNVPSARQGAVSWTDISGNFWLFAGF
jgi:hypothetical protein